MTDCFSAKNTSSSDILKTNVFWSEIFVETLSDLCCFVPILWKKKFLSNESKDHVMQKIAGNSYSFKANHNLVISHYLLMPGLAAFDSIYQ